MAHGPDLRQITRLPDKGVIRRHAVILAIHWRRQRLNADKFAAQGSRILRAVVVAALISIARLRVEWEGAMSITALADAYIEVTLGGVELHHAALVILTRLRNAQQLDLGTSRGWVGRVINRPALDNRIAGFPAHYAIGARVEIIALTKNVIDVDKTIAGVMRVKGHAEHAAFIAVEHSGFDIQQLAHFCRHYRFFVGECVDRALFIHHIHQIIGAVVSHHYR